MLILRIATPIHPIAELRLPRLDLELPGKCPWGYFPQLTAARLGRWTEPFTAGFATRWPLHPFPISYVPVFPRPVKRDLVFVLERAQVRLSGVRKREPVRRLVADLPWAGSSANPLDDVLFVPDIAFKRPRHPCVRRA